MLNNGNVEVCLKEDVDKAITELKEENTQLKQKLEDVNEFIKTARQMLEDAKATHYTESVDAGMRERKLRRALYKACANWAHATIYYSGVHESDEFKWENMETECLKKAEEYK